MKNTIIKSFFVLTLFIAFACGHSTDVVESGNYEGKIIEIEADEVEIYVKTDDGKVLELYFTDTTKLTQNGEEVPFETLEEDQTVEVEVEKVGKRLDPISVTIK